MLRLYTDVHVNLAITKGLRMRGIDVLTAQEDGARELDDEPLLGRAASLGRVLFTQDEDLLAIASERQKAFSSPGSSMDINWRPRSGNTFWNLS